MSSTKGLFRIIIYSSNDPHFLDERPGYYICQHNKGLKLLQAVPTHAPSDVCGDSMVYIPKSKTDFVQVMDSLDTTNLSRPFRSGIEFKNSASELLDVRAKSVAVTSRPRIKDYGRIMRD